jgi:hypothetical protein
VNKENIWTQRGMQSGMKKRELENWKNWVIVKAS